MNRHWKTFAWMLVVAVAFAVLAHATQTYVLMIAVTYVTIITWFVLAASFMDESKPARRHR